jgi:ubiquitin C-terminal hydrolase
LDHRIKETTVIHQIFGGYLQSCVKCSTCQHESKTFDPMLDLSLEIENCNSVTTALEKYTKAELLSGANKYKCERYFRLSVIH